MNSYFCLLCKISLNSQSQWDQHITGSKHLRRIANTPSQPIKVENLFSSTEARNTCSKESVQEISTTSSENCLSCMICKDFFCTGTIPMQAHLQGKKHLKKLRHLQSTSIESNQPIGSSIPSNFPYEAANKIFLEGTPILRIERALAHNMVKCDFFYIDRDSTQSSKILSEMSPHFAFILKNESIPNLLVYIQKEQ